KCSCQKRQKTATLKPFESAFYPRFCWRHYAAHPRLLYAAPRHHPLVLCDPQVCEGYCRELKRLLNTLEHKLNVVEEVSSLDMMLTLVGAGYGIGFMTATKIPISQRPDVVIRPLAMDSAVITTYLLRPDGGNLSASVERFIVRLRDSSDG
ncbi:LysR substrate-binding domain-containing protein, partial [Burkholderia cenocepacia]|uniref:LysR substrate-binding domain-containing protein n=1 Tax=Burkholderia cenocepacia TaxID=95486 RepID=UPI002012D567